MLTPTVREGQIYRKQDQAGGLPSPGGLLTCRWTVPRPSRNACLADSGIAPPGQEGWTRHQEKYREAPLMERTGWWFNFNKSF